MKTVNASQQKQYKQEVRWCVATGEGATTTAVKHMIDFKYAVRCVSGLGGGRVPAALRRCLLEEEEEGH